MKTGRSSEVRTEIEKILKRKFPTNRLNSPTGIDWAGIENEYLKIDKLFKRSTLRRYLGYAHDEKTLTSAKYDDLQYLERIKSILEGKYKEPQESITLTSSYTTNFQGFYLILSPSSFEGMLNLFPLEILPNGDFELNYIHIGDIIRGITSFSSNHISLYANRKYNNTTQSSIPFFLHSVFNVQASNSRNDLKPFNLGVATRRKRNTDGLKAVMEILIKIEKPMFDAFEGTALTLEKDSDNEKFYLLRGTKDYLDEQSTQRLLQYKIEVDAKATKGSLRLIEKELGVIVDEFYNFLVNNNGINLEEKDFIKLSEIENKLKEILDL